MIPRNASVLLWMLLIKYMNHVFRRNTLKLFATVPEWLSQYTRFGFHQVGDCPTVRCHFNTLANDIAIGQTHLVELNRHTHGIKQLQSKSPWPRRLTLYNADENFT
ncbi:Uncharacterised protein [Vibrio cholerae]|uniref:Uncharacterized protein n=1 Tax=Vibrio cholerae TaxID=666 RepID=A0A655USI9_VIBCL|nr:Uncharacterised protein [Vibrio cholerae]